MNAPIILVPGFWLGAWAWDEVAATLRADGHDVTAITLPGLESTDADRSSITFADHVDAIVNAVHGGAVAGRARRAQRRPGSPATPPATVSRIGSPPWSTSIPPRASAPLDPDFKDVEKPMVWSEIEEEENLDGLSDAQKATFRERAVPVPGGVIREPFELTNDARKDIPSTLICTGFTAEQYQTYAKEQPVASFLAGIPELRNATWIDLPTSHWPMWSRPTELAAIIGDVAKDVAPDAVAVFEPLIGEWQAEGQMPLEPPMRISGKATIERLGEFIVFRTMAEQAEVPDSLSIIGGAPDGEPQPMHYFDARGVQRLYLTAIDGSTWKIWRAPGEDWNGPDGPGFNQRFIGEISADGTTIEARWERGMGDAGDAWEIDFPITYRRT